MVAVLVAIGFQVLYYQELPTSYIDMLFFDLIKCIDLEPGWANYGSQGHLWSVKLFNPARITWRNYIDSK